RDGAPVSYTSSPASTSASARWPAFTHVVMASATRCWVRSPVPASPNATKPDAVGPVAAVVLVLVDGAPVVGGGARVVDVELVVVPEPPPHATAAARIEAVKPRVARPTLSLRPWPPWPGAARRSWSRRAR